ncbi:hypothetical protein TTHERM_00006180 (macronuclear) [Tetrahymena thermophila SB210]|uniref:Uncharacterized protein n=1 Tax=Tetrahymena thermophila (strain SB210) TaxID=312017 RepID=Q22SB8_TETTS|nr:hypothetical protein TTHERM_00006180 [Tetrahymena thermophila SB210]EAR87854.2 hypothetical protein TTHERM_00006180 [Tetrahymena thermophila SB210]|eukprot:XP_001008099.2 hypothetical protein TTHERM_00006180 [Tetrahymena thermophila SB210]
MKKVMEIQKQVYDTAKQKIQSNQKILEFFQLLINQIKNDENFIKENQDLKETVEELTAQLKIVLNDEKFSQNKEMIQNLLNQIEHLRTLKEYFKETFQQNSQESKDPSDSQKNNEKTSSKQ